MLSRLLTEGTKLALGRPFVHRWSKLICSPSIAFRASSVNSSLHSHPSMAPSLDACRRVFCCRSGASICSRSLHFDWYLFQSGGAFLLRIVRTTMFPLSLHIGGKARSSMLLSHHAQIRYTPSILLSAAGWLVRWIGAEVRDLAEVFFCFQTAGTKVTWGNARVSRVFSITSGIMPGEAPPYC